MTSLQMDNPSQQVQGDPGLGQSNQSSPKYDEVRQRMDQLRRHHNESAEIHNRTQPMIDEQIHEETIKYLKNGQVNGTKAKTQKPRAPKKPRAQATGMSNNSLSAANHNPPMSQPSHQVVSSTTNGYPTSNHLLQPVNQISNGVGHQGQGVQQHHAQQQLRMTYYTPQHPQQQQLPQHRNVHIQQHPNQITTSPQQIPQQQHQNNYNYHHNNGLYAQQSQLQHAPQQNPYQTQPQIKPQQVQHQQSPHVQQQPYLQAQRPIHSHSNHQQMPNTSHIHHQQVVPGHSQHLQRPQHVTLNSNGAVNPMPVDLDFNLQAGLECDIDSLINHEMSMEGNLNFDYDLLLKLDNQYQPRHM